MCQCTLKRQCSIAKLLKIGILFWIAIFVSHVKIEYLQQEELRGEQLRKQKELRSNPISDVKADPASLKILETKEVNKKLLETKSVNKKLEERRSKKLKKKKEEKLKDGQKRKKSRMDKRKKGKGGEGQKKIILLSYSRSGSTFTGVLLSSYPDTTYFFEPFHGSKDLDKNKVFPLLDRIFSCSVTKKDFKKPAQKMEGYSKQKCRKSPVILTKIIRLPLKIVNDWLKKRVEKDIKVIHLVRDPRGIASSLNHVGGKWGNKNVSTLCTKIKNDLQEAKTVSKDQYMRIKYEELCKSPVTITEKVLQFAGLTMTPEVLYSVKLHTKFEQFYKKEVGKEEKPPAHLRVSPFSTFRFSNFNPDHHWKNLKIDQIRSIEQQCSSILKEADYKIYEEGKEKIEKSIFGVKIGKMKGEIKEAYQFLKANNLLGKRRKEKDERPKRKGTP